MSYAATAAALVGQDFLSTLVVALLALGPGWLAADGIARRLGWSLAATIAAALAVTTAIVSVGSLAGNLAGASGLAVALAVTIVLGAAASYAGWRIGRASARQEIGLEGLLLGGGATLLAIVTGPYMGLTADTFYHLAAANSLLASGRSMVTDPMYGTSTQVLDPTSGAWHSMLALMSRVTTLTPDWLWGGLTAVAAGCLVLAFWALARTVSGSARAATWATLAWVAFALFADVRAAAYPKMGSLAIVFIALCAVIELAGEPSWPAAAFAIVGGFAASAAHLGSAQLLYAGVAAVWVWVAVDALVATPQGGHGDRRPLAAVSGVAAALAATAAIVVLPRLGALGGGAGLVDVARPDISGSLVHWPLGIVTAKPGAFMGGGPVLSVLLLVATVLAAWDALGSGRRRAAIGGLALASLPWITIYDPIFATLANRYSPYVLERVGALFTFAPYVAIAWLLGRLVGDGRLSQAPRWLAYAMLVAAAVVGAIPLAGTFAKVGERRGNRYPVYVSRLKDIRVEWSAGLAGARALFAETPGAVVAGSPETSYYLAGLSRGIVIVAAPRSHSPYVIEQDSGESRRADMARLLDPKTTEKEAAAIQERYGVTFLALDRGVASERAAYDVAVRVGTPLVVSDRLCVVRVGG